MFYSIIIPVYNRPEEIDELLMSLTQQDFREFEVIVVEDGSDVPCEHIVEKYLRSLSISYYFKQNSGPGKSRNYGADRSRGDYLIFVDSDCIIPRDYLKEVDKELTASSTDLFGGGDKADNSFSAIQKAINYAMTSFFTTGGIRGGKNSLDKFYPRTFNLGIRKCLFESIGGFSDMRFGEDLDFSIRVMEAGYSSKYLPDAWVYHKRRTDFKKFFKQIYNSGIARISLYKKYPESLKWVHWLPALFTIITIALLVTAVFYHGAFLFLLVYIFLIWIDASIKTKSISVGGLAILASFIQLVAYGTGFIWGIWRMIFLKKGETAAFEKTFYK